MKPELSRRANEGTSVEDAGKGGEEMDKPKIAMYWCASCGGCEEATVDIAERILDLVKLVDIVFWPVALDFKIEDVEALPDGSIAASLINGGVRLTEHEHMVKLLRRKSRIVVAYGACSSWGGIPGLANLYDDGEFISRAYHEVPSLENPHKVTPQKTTAINGIELELPEALSRLLPIDRVVDVDYYVPGCPPTAEATWKAVEILLSGKLPPKGSVIGASEKSLCDECPLNETKPDKVLIQDLKRPYEVIADPEKCLLTQGLLCLGPATRGGCGALCVKARMPCTGCFGPLDRVSDYGAKAASFIASILDFQDEEAIEKVIDRLPDPVGTFYRYTLASSSLGGKARRK
jgi:F420-non-reducing hydrogenase small subunit